MPKNLLFYKKLGIFFLYFPSGSNRTTFDNIFYIFYFTEDMKLVTDFSLNYRECD